MKNIENYVRLSKSRHELFELYLNEGYLLTDKERIMILGELLSIGKELDKILIENSKEFQDYFLATN